MLVYGFLILLPTVVLNGAMWGQCDSIYTFFVLLGILFLLKNKIVFSFLSLGLAFAFKLQFIFILPLFVFMYFTDKNKMIRFKYFLLIPLCNLILCIPAFVFGVSIKKILLMYVIQVQDYNNFLSINFPNFYELINGFHPIVYILFIILLLVSLAYLFILYEKNLNGIMREF